MSEVGHALRSLATQPSEYGRVAEWERALRAEPADEHPEHRTQLTGDEGGVRARWNVGGGFGGHARSSQKYRVYPGSLYSLPV
jgi:hypothetical protein